MKKSKTNAEHYKWGDNCDGWRLVDTEGLSVIEEKMPPKTAESLHFHAKSQQFFYILEGIATFESEKETFEVFANEGFYMPPLVKHRVFNHDSTDLRFLVISQPTTRHDRFNVEL